jgi:TRAP-type mannitol/chloroaromatic compound transport system permease small subunit
MQKLKATLAFIDNFNEWVGKIFGLIIIPIVGIIVFEVIMRYAFNAPTIWVNELSWYLFGAMFLFGGAYASKTKSHVNVDILLIHISPKAKAILNLITYWFAFLFLVIVIWKGAQIAALSIEANEHSHTIWGPPVWGVKLMVPIGAFLMLVQTLAWYIRDIYTAVTGEEGKL